MASNKITKKDLNEVAVRSMAEQCCFSFERMQAVGFCYGMTKCFRKIHGDNNEEMAAAMENNLDFINTEPHMAAILQGLIVSMEEAGQNREMIHSLKTGLFGPLAGLGDAIWWYTAMPIIASICCSLATQNNVLGPIFYILFWALTAQAGGCTALPAPPFLSRLCTYDRQTGHRTARAFLDTLAAALTLFAQAAGPGLHSVRL